LAYSAFENGNFTSSAQALNDFIAKVEPTRLISQDYLYLGRAQMKDTTKFQEGMANIEKAVALDSTNAVVMSEIGQALYKGKKYVEAARAYEIAILNPERALLDYYYLGMSYYFTYGAQNAAKLNPPKDLLVKADTAFSFLVKRSPTTQAGWQYRGRINRLLDENDSKGLAVPYYEAYVKLVTLDKPELAAKSVPGLIEAYNYLGSVALRKDSDKLKAKEYFDKVILLDPSNVTAKESIAAIASLN
jgi:tetratricopeptide (TPR) repeat protein